MIICDRTYFVMNTPLQSPSQWRAQDTWLFLSACKGASLSVRARRERALGWRQLGLLGDDLSFAPPTRLLGMSRWCSNAIALD